MAKPQAKPRNEIAVKKPEAMVLVQDQVPDYIRQESNRGSENVGTEDIVIPRLEVIQGLSPAVKRGDPKYIQGAQAGMLTNSVTRQLYGDNVTVVPVYYTKQWLVWRDQSKGGGFAGAYETQQEAQARADKEGGEKEGWGCIDTPQHLCLLINPESHDCEEIMVSMPRTKAKISRQWNSMIRLAGGDRFSRAYTFGTALEKNDKGDFYNLTVTLTGFPTKVVYLRAEELYKRIASGARKVVMDTSDLDDHGAAGSEM